VRASAPSSPIRLLARAFLTCTALVGVPTYAQTVLPRGGSVVSGNATIGPVTGGTMSVTQTSQHAIINWDSFSVGAGQSIRFNQPNADAAILNRVTGSATSTIAGQITGNGQVYLINPNGIAITATGTVQLGGGFVASTLDIADADFMNGKLAFKGGGTSASVTNGGSIRIGNGGFAALLGGSVANTGTISVPLGKVGLGSGAAATLDIYGDGFLQIGLPSTANGADPLITAAGSISGARVEVRAAALVGALRNVVNVPGNLQATAAHMDGGALVLDAGDGAVEVSGKLDASSATGTGGKISLGGAQITLTGAQLDASGAAGGGVITIGGGSHGAAVAGLTTADSVAIDAGTAIKADARGSGNGGQVTVWSNDDTRFSGTISAQALGGSR